MTNPRPVSPEGPAPLDCPFCGSKPSVRHHKNLGVGISCGEQDCAAWTGITADSFEEAVASWNRRPSRSAGSPETQQRIAEIRERLEKAAPGPWSWSRSYELADAWADAWGDLTKHWCLHNPDSDAKGMTIDGRLVLWDSSATDIDGRPFEQTPNLALIAHAPADLGFLLDLISRPSPGEAGAPADSERLDWLGSHPNAFGLVRDYLTFGTSDVRRAIDAARADRSKADAARSTPAAQET